jgi:sec-independent protein translocase protein TatC
LGIGACLVLSITFGSKIIELLKKPYVDIVGNDIALQTLAPTDGFSSYVKLCIVVAILLASPWCIYHIWKFVEEGLSAAEKKYFKWSAPLCMLLFICGAAFLMFVVSPLVMKFLISFNYNVLGVQSLFTFQKYIAFISGLILVFGLVFETPVIVVIVNKCGIVSLQNLKKARKFVFWAVFVIAALITPPDVVSQLCLALPMYLLFELGILFCRMI